MSAIFMRAYRMMGKEIGHMVSRGAKIFKMASEGGKLTNEMSIELFSGWKVDQLKKKSSSLTGEKNMSSLRRRILHES